MVLKISITLSLENRKPTETEIHRNRLISSHFGRFRLRISQTKIFGFGWPYPYKPTETEPNTPLRSNQKSTTDTKCKFGSTFTFAFCVLLFFFFPFLHAFQTLRGQATTVEYCSVLFGPVFFTFLSISGSVHCSWTHKFHFLSIFSLKIGPTVLFTHLKIILLQCFQFSVSAK